MMSRVPNFGKTRDYAPYASVCVTRLLKLQKWSVQDDYKKSSCMSLLVPYFGPHTNDQWEFQDPKIEVLYHIRPYFGENPFT